MFKLVYLPTDLTITTGTYDELAPRLATLDLEYFAIVPAGAASVASLPHFYRDGFDDEFEDPR